MTSETRVTLFDNETHLDIAGGRELAVGDVLPVYRGNGPREGELMGWATVSSVSGDSPELVLRLSDSR